MKAKGKVVAVKGKYFVQVGDLKHELVPSVFGSVETFKQMAGQDVEVILSDPELVAVKPIGTLPRPCFLCYVPRPDFMQIYEISPAVRQGILKVFKQEGLIGEELVR